MRMQSRTERNDARIPGSDYSEIQPLDPSQALTIYPRNPKHPTRPDSTKKEYSFSRYLTTNDRSRCYDVI
jgi:hypothetical protein